MGESLVYNQFYSIKSIVIKKIKVVRVLTHMGVNRDG